MSSDLVRVYGEMLRGAWQWDIPDRQSISFPKPPIRLTLGKCSTGVAALEAFLSFPSERKKAPNVLNGKHAKCVIGYGGGVSRFFTRIVCVVFELWGAAVRALVVGPLRETSELLISCDFYAEMYGMRNELSTATCILYAHYMRIRGDVEMMILISRVHNS